MVGIQGYLIINEKKYLYILRFFFCLDVQLYFVLGQVYPMIIIQVRNKRLEKTKFLMKRFFSSSLDFG